MPSLSDSNNTDVFDRPKVVVSDPTLDTPLIGQKTSANSIPVVLPSDQTVAISVGTVTTIEFDHYRIHQGTSYHFSNHSSYANNEVKGFIVETGAKTLHLTINVFLEPQAEVDIYEAPTGETTSTVYTWINRNRTSANTCSSTLKLASVLPSSPGTQLMMFIMGSAASSGASSQYTRAQEWILKTSTKYYIKITSLASSNDITISLDGYETS
jgi:hypothetical protein